MLAGTQKGGIKVFDNVFDKFNVYPVEWNPENCYNEEGMFPSAAIAIGNIQTVTLSNRLGYRTLYPEPTY